MGEERPLRPGERIGYRIGMVIGEVIRFPIDLMRALFGRRR